MKVKRRKKITAKQGQIAANRGIGWCVWLILWIVGGTSLVFSLLHPQRQSPETSITYSWQKRLDHFLTASVFWHDNMLRAVTNWTLLTGGNRVENVYLSQERLLERPAVLDSKQMTETAGLLYTFYQTSQIPMCVIAVPAASELYADATVGGAPCPSQLEAIDSFYQALPTQIRKIDAYHVLLNGTEDYIYNRTDPRWTCYGAYSVYRSAIQKMGFAPISYDQFVVNHADTFRGSLYQTCLYEKVMPDILDVYTCSSGSQITEMTALLPDDTEEARSLYQMPSDADDPYDYYLGGECDKLEIQTDLNNGKKLLLIKDSNADCMVPFLLQHYSELAAVDIEDTSRPLGELVDVSAYSQVLVLCDADTLADSQLFLDLFSAETRGEGEYD